ncbi:MAG: type II toxin-antitoxin system prevent-host-death family antitoxin [Deltaproteobacteria bacterium]|nr:type II toxin-antitoxin system prevent-host-death family antitoxin [Deltaproteobacteria bacterium]
MTRIASVRQLRDRIGPLLHAVEAGDQVVVTRRGRPVARIVPEGPPVRPALRHPLRGSLRRISRDFDRPIEGLWEALEE